MSIPRLRLVLAVLLAVLLAGCAPLALPEQPERSAFIKLLPGEHLGQTFTARFSGLQGVAVFLKPGETPPAGLITLRLVTPPPERQELSRVQVDAALLTRPQFFQFSFPPAPGSSQTSYAFELDFSGTGSVLAAAAPGETYLDGSAYRQDEPIDRQLTFRLLYRPSMLLGGLAREGLAWLLWLMAACLALGLPGWALLSLAWPGWRGRDAWEKIALACGIGAALYPVILLFTHILGLHLGAAYAWGTLLIAALACAWPVWRTRRVGQHRLRRLTLPHWQAADLALVGVLVLTFGVRFWAVRDLAAPMWGDSYQHTLMAQLIVQNGGLFDSWLPYVELETFTYHFGFHSLASVFHWLARLPVPETVLVLGQILNGLAVLAVYPLAKQLGGSRWAGVLAVLVAGLLAPMPMSYVNMGRYTQLAGLLILPAAILLAWQNLEQPARGWKVYLPAWVALGGLALTHYRVLIFAVLFFPALALFSINRQTARVFMIRLAWLAGGSGLLALPWYIHLYGGKILATLQSHVQPALPENQAFMQAYNTLGDLLYFLPAWLWLLLSLSLAWAFWRRERQVAIMAGWWFLLFWATNPQWLGLPGAGVITNFALLISLYFPASVILGAAAGWLLERLPGRGGLWQAANVQRAPAAARQLARPIQAGLLVLVACLAAWGAFLRLEDLTPAQSVLVTHPDQRAFAWIRSNLPADAHFLVNSFPAYGDTSIAGSDAGWWLPLLAGRTSTLPPLTYSAERGPRPDFQAWTNALTFQILADGLTHADTLAMLAERGVTHVFIGQRQGQVNSGGRQLDLDELLADPHFRRVYHEDRVWIFAFAQ